MLKQMLVFTYGVIAANFVVYSVIAAEHIGIEDKVMEARGKWKSGHFVAEVVLLDADGLEEQKRVFNLYFEGLSNRCDQNELNKSAETLVSLHDNQVYEWMKGDGLPPTPKQTQVDRSRLDHEGVSYLPYNARMLGLSTDGIAFVHQEQLNSIEFATQNRASVRTTDEFLEGLPCTVVHSSIPKSASQLHVWIPKHEPDVVSRILLEYNIPGGSDTGSEQIDATWAKHDATGLNVPTSITLASSSNGKVIYKVVSTITVKSLNEPLGEEVFTFKGMGVPAGMNVHLYPNDPRGEVFWDGERLSPKSVAGTSLTARSRRPIVAVFWWLSAILAAVSVYFAWRSARTG